MTSPLSRAGVCTLVAALAFSLPAAAEDLMQVLELARQHDAKLMAAQDQNLATAARVGQARGSLLPSLTLVGSESKTRFRQDGVADAVADNRTGSLALNLKQPLFNAGLSTDLGIAKVNAESAELDYRLAQQDFILEVAQAYFNVLSAQEVLETRRLSKESIAGQLDAAVRKFKAGLGIITDQEDAQARYNLAEAEELAAENVLRVSRLTLERLTGRPGIAPKPATQTATLAHLAPARLEDLLRDAVEHPAVLRARLDLEKAGLDRQRARAGLLPTLDLTGSVSKNRVTGTPGLSSSLPAGRSTVSTIGLELNVPLFSGFSTVGRMDEATHLEDRARKLLTAAIRSAEESTEKAYYDLQSALAKARALAAAEAASKSSLEGTQRGYKAGIRLNLDVLNAQAQLYQTRSDLAKIRYETLILALRLQAAVGKLDTASLAEIGSLH